MWKFGTNSAHCVNIDTALNLNYHKIIDDIDLPLSSIKSYFEPGEDKP